MYCNRCGKGIPEDANLCSYCGSRVGGTTVRKRLVPLEGEESGVGAWSAKEREIFPGNFPAGSTAGGSL